MVLAFPKYPNKKFAYFCNIFRKTWGIKLIFYLQINMNVFYKLLISHWVCISKHAQSTQNNKFAISFFAIYLFLKKGARDEVDCFFMQISMKVTCKLILWFLMGMVRHFQSSQNSKFAMSLPYLKKREVTSVSWFFAAEINVKFQQTSIWFQHFGYQFSYKVILLLLIDMIKHSSSTQSNKFAISLKYLKKIS